MVELPQVSHRGGLEFVLEQMRLVSEEKVGVGIVNAVVVGIAGKAPVGMIPGIEVDHIAVAEVTPAGSVVLEKSSPMVAEEAQVSDILPLTADLQD